MRTRLIQYRDKIPYELHGVIVGAMGGEPYEIFDPPWWAIHRWVWWLFMTRYHGRWRAIRATIRRLLLDLRLLSKPALGEVRPRSEPSFKYGIIDFRVDRWVRSVRVWRITEVNVSYWERVPWHGNR
jgi:hypothetical protein